MPRLKLTKREVDRIPAVEKPTYFFDTQLPGFFLRVMPTGSKAWGFEYRAGSGRGAKKKRVTIAGFGKLTPEEARTAAKGFAASVARGADPATDKGIKAREMTVEGLVALYAAEGCFVQRGLRQGEPMKARTKAYTLARLQHHAVPLLGHKRLSEVGPGDIERFVRDVAKGKTATTRTAARAKISIRGGEGAARKVVRDLSAVFSFATRRGHIATNPCSVAAVRKTDNRRRRFLTFHEMSRLGEALRSLEVEGVNSKAVNISRLWALTGCRRNEVAALRWSEVNFDDGMLILEDTKTGKSVRPLGAPALALLSNIVRQPGSPFVFPSERGATHYQGTKRIWKEAIRRASLPGVTPHTLRHSLGSTATSSGEALALTGAILGHANHRSTAIYAHVQNDPSRRAADRVAEVVAAALQGKVTPIRGVRVSE